jgi:hypothetical protein
VSLLTGPLPFSITLVELTFRGPIVFLVILLSGAAPAFSQATGSQHLPGGLFGGGEVSRRVHHKLDFSLSLVEANDSDTPAELRGIGPSDTVSSGYSTMFMGNGEYHWDHSRVQVGATGASVLRRYDQPQSVRSVSGSGGLGLAARLGGRTTLLANQSVAYSPSYLYGLFPSDAVKNPGDAVPVAADYAISDSESYQYGTTLTLTRGLTRRSRLSATGEFQYTDYLHETGTQRDLNSEGVHGEYSNSLARNTALRLGYRYRTGKFGYGVGAIATDPGVTATEQGIDFGVAYSRPLSATRRMMFSSNFGSSTVATPISSAAGTGANRLIRLSGDVAAGWQFTSSWQTRATFRRGLEYVAQLTEPVYIDGFSAELGGLVTRRIDVQTSARYSSGVSALNRDALAFGTRGADLRMQYAVTRSLAVYTQYLYYFYDFTGNAQLPTGIPSGLERHGVRAGLTLWVPAVRR